MNTLNQPKEQITFQSPLTTNGQIYFVYIEINATAKLFNGEKLLCTEKGINTSGELYAVVEKWQEHIHASFPHLSTETKLNRVLSKEVIS